MEQFAIMGMLAREGMKIQPKEAIELPLRDFGEVLHQLTWGDPPNSIAPKLVANDGRYDYTFDLYNFGTYKLSIYYSLNGHPTLFIIFGNAGEFVFLRKWMDEL